MSAMLEAVVASTARDLRYLHARRNDGADFRAAITPDAAQRVVPGAAIAFGSAGRIMRLLATSIHHTVSVVGNMTDITRRTNRRQLWRSWAYVECPDLPVRRVRVPINFWRWCRRARRCWALKRWPSAIAVGDHENPADCAIYEFLDRYDEWFPDTYPTAPFGTKKDSYGVLVMHTPPLPSPVNVITA